MVRWLIALLLAATATANLRFVESLHLNESSKPTVGPVFFGPDLVLVRGNELLLWTKNNSASYVLNLTATIPVEGPFIYVATEVTPGSRIAVQQENKTSTTLLSFDSDMHLVATALTPPDSDKTNRTGTVMAFSWGNKRLFIGYSDGSIHVWELDDHDQYIFKQVLEGGVNEPILELSVGYGLTLLSMTFNYTAQWQTKQLNGNYTLTKLWRNSTVSSVAICPSVDVVFAFGYRNGAIKIFRWNFDQEVFDQTENLFLSKVSLPIMSLQFSNECKRMVSTANNIRYWLHNELTGNFEMEQQYPGPIAEAQMSYESVAALGGMKEDPVIQIYVIESNCSLTANVTGTMANGTCICADNFEWDGERCNYLPCQLIRHSTGHVSPGTCACATNFEWNFRSLLCEIDCGNLKNTVRGGTADTCLCLEGYRWSDMQCISDGVLPKNIPAV